MNLNDFDFVNDVEKVIVTGGKDGCIASVYHKNGQIDQHVFVKGQSFKMAQGEI